MKHHHLNVGNASLLALGLSATVFAGLTSCGGYTPPTDTQLATGYKPLENHNPIATQRFGADPYAMEYNGRVYVYMTNDMIEKNGDSVINNTYSKINKIFCVSSEDLVNWTDHGAMPIAGADGAAKWATNSWAPTACHKTIDGKEKFFLYFANNGNGIGVVTSDTPFGPWSDPLGKPIISRQTPTCAEVTWLFDPAVLIDDNGDGYIFVGGGVPMGKDGKPNFADPGTARVAKLDASLTALDGDPVAINPPYLFEDAGANKIGDTYYYSYCTNFNSPELGNGCIAYMTSQNPMGPYKFAKVIFDNPGAFFGRGGNNHHAICKLDNNYYLFYHASILEQDMGISGGYRSTNVDPVTIDADGNIQTITGTRTGVQQLKAFDPYNNVEAETMAWEGGIDTRYDGDTQNMIVTANNGDWLGLSGVDFGEGAKSLTVKALNNGETGSIIIRLDKPDGDNAGFVVVDNTKGSFNNFTAKFDKPLTGKHDLFFVFVGDLEIDTWQFGK